MQSYWERRDEPDLNPVFGLTIDQGGFMLFAALLGEVVYHWPYSECPPVFMEAKDHTCDDQSICLALHFQNW